MIEEWNNKCPECGCDNTANYDVDGHSDTYYWQCLACGHKFTTTTIHILDLRE